MDAIRNYLDWHALRSSSGKHLHEVERVLRHFEKAIGKRVEEAGKSECSAYLRGFQQKGRKPATLFAYHTVLAAFFSWLVEEEHIDTSPMKKVPQPAVPKEQVKPLSSEELLRLLDQTNPSTFCGVRDKALISLMADSGLRVSEALSIKVGDIDFSLRSIVVVGKGGSEREAFFGQAVEKLLKAYLRKRGETKGKDLLFVNSLGEKLLRWAVTERIREYGQKAGIEGKRCSAHTLRHTFAVSYLRNGGDALSLQRFLGHSSPDMTQKYVNYSPEDLRNKHRSNSPIDRLAVKTEEKPQRRKRLR